MELSTKSKDAKTPKVTAPAKKDSSLMGKGATRKVARHAAELKYADLPPTLVRLIKQCVLDTLGVVIGASTLAPEGKIVADYVRSLGGKPESTLLGFGGKAPVAWAVFLNGSLTHMLDYDDVDEISHVSGATVPGAFAVAERLGGANGQELIASIAAGIDVQTRLTQSIDIPDWTMSQGWFATQLFGFISGAATAGRLLHLNEEQMENAFGIGFNQSSGSRQMAVSAATHMRSMQAGFSGQGAILAAELAQRGIVGSKEVIEGRYGVFKNYVRTNTPKWDALLDGLGTCFPILETHCFKIWPACASTRRTNWAILQMREEHSLRPEDIDSIMINSIAGDKPQSLSEPIELKRRPKTSIDGKFSIPFTAAAMMVRGNVTLRDYTPQGLCDPEVLAMADRISYRALTPIPGVPPLAEAEPIVEIRTKDGRVFSRQPKSVPGDPRNPVDHAVLEKKFRDCVSFSAKPIAPANIDRAIHMIADLENIPDATEIIRLLA